MLSHLFCIKIGYFKIAIPPNITNRCKERGEESANDKIQNFRKRMHNFGCSHRPKNHHSFLRRDAVETRARPTLSSIWLADPLYTTNYHFHFHPHDQESLVKVLCQMYAHIYGYKHAEYLCPFANTLNDKSFLRPNHLISCDLRWKTC